MMDRVQVRFRDCGCPGSPHPEGDVVYVTAKLGLEAGLACTQDRMAATDQGDLIRRWIVSLVRWCAVGWNVTDEKGAPVPFSPAILLDDYELAAPVADALADRFVDTLIGPFPTCQPPTSPPGPTADSTSATPTSITRRPARSSRGTSAASGPSMP